MCSETRETALGTPKPLSGLRPLQVMLPNPHPWDTSQPCLCPCPAQKELLKMVLHQGPAGPRDGLECPISGVFVPRNVVWVRGTASALSLPDSPVPPAWLSRCAETPALAEEESSQWKRPWRIPTHQLGSGHFGRALELSAMSRVHPLSGSFLPLLLLLSLLKDRGRGAVRREARRVMGTRRRQCCHSQSILPKLLLPQPFPTSSPLEVDPKLSSP